jgi:hypothetical protein
MAIEPTKGERSDVVGAALFVLRPSGRAYWAWLKATAGVAVLIWGVGAVRAATTGDWVLVLALVISSPVLAAMGGAGWLYLHRVSVIATETHVAWVGMSGRPRWRARRDIRTVLTVTMHKIGDSSTFENLSILDEDGNRMVRLTGVCWSDEDRQRLVDWTEVPPLRPDGAFTGPEIARSFPDAVPLAERHPVVTSLVIVAATLAVVGPLVLVLIALAD